VVNGLRGLTNPMYRAGEVQQGWLCRSDQAVGEEMVML
jgi:hypothetical protein